MKSKISLLSLLSLEITATGEKWQKEVWVFNVAVLLTITFDRRPQTWLGWFGASFKSCQAPVTSLMKQCLCHEYCLLKIFKNSPLKITHALPHEKLTLFIYLSDFFPPTRALVSLAMTDFRMFCLWQSASKWLHKLNSTVVNRILWKWLYLAKQDSNYNNTFVFIQLREKK